MNDPTNSSTTQRNRPLVVGPSAVGYLRSLVDAATRGDDSRALWQLVGAVQWLLDDHDHDRGDAA